MTWGKVSDDLHGHPKWRGVSPNAKAVWVTALSYCNAYLTNGLVDDDAAAQIAIETFGPTREAFDLFDAAAAELVGVRAPEAKAGLWKRTRRGFVFHQWTEHQPEAEDAKQRKMRYQRKQQLHNTAKGRRIKAQVLERDHGRCRYCGVHTAAQGDDGVPRTYDHVDPDGANSVANVVIACGRCNKRKASRTPDDAGMALLEPGTADRSADRSPTRSARRESRETRPGDRVDGTHGSGRVGSGRVGSDRAGTERSGQGTDEPGAQVLEFRARPGA